LVSSRFAVVVVLEMVSSTRKNSPSDFRSCRGALSIRP